ncbi:uncharacterized protein LOC106646579 [Copidosoma floridanum]|uniref:uncharacterized protein LOC106646579 n=1 Tax=Copidosoma floridanum TaxID=29053 RepID=UPI0006C94915|nr:uncharacterized protein LOC106646579 [Copidosoma floridanum]
MALKGGWLPLVCLMGLASALGPLPPHRMSEESLRGALSAVARKQRSLNSAPHDYYLELPMTRLGGPEDKLSRGQQVATDDMDNDALDFIPPGTGQVETIGDGYQHLGNRQHLERALMDYLQYGTDQANEDDEPARSVFRERERTGSRKRTSNDQQDLLSDKMLRLLQDLENEQAPNRAYPGNSVEMYRQLVSGHRKPGQGRIERRNVNARYPLFNREYGYTKRFPVSKRSAKSAATTKKRQAVVTDPKLDAQVAQDLGSLFGGNGVVNRSHEHEHDHEHDHEHKHGNEVAKVGVSLKDGSAKLANKTIRERSIQVRKKSVDWSQYFGIDRRKKKTVYAAKPDSRDQDNEYLLQKYYEIMAENLKPSVAGKSSPAGEKRGTDQLQQVDSELRDMKDTMMDEAVQVSSRNDMGDQQVKDEIMSRLATAYSLEKLRRALEELSSSADTTAQQQHSAVAEQTSTSNMTDARSATENKRNNPRNDDSGNTVVQAGAKGCPQMMLAEARCRANEVLVDGFREALHIPCVMYQICSSCEDDNCLERFALEVERVCQDEEEEEGEDEEEEEELQLRGLPSVSKKRCAEDALMVTRPRLEGLAAASVCRALQSNQRCFDIYQQHYIHPRLYGVLDLSRNRLGHAYNR